MKITKDNYFDTVNKIGFENLPMVLKQSHTVILTKTVNGEDWSKYKNDAELKRMIDLVFKKLEEFIKSQKENLSGAGEELNGSVPQVPYGKENDVDYHFLRHELMFINRFLQWNNQSITKKELLKFIDDLQSAILNRRIRKTSKLASIIKLIQEKSLTAYNGMKGDTTKISFQPETLKALNDAIEKAQSKKPKKLPKIKAPKKIASVELNGTPENQDKIMNSIDFTNLEFNTIGFTDKWLGFIGDPAPGFTAMVYGRPKMGKSYLCVDFAGYLARNHGKVLYVAKEEKLDATLQKKLKDKDVANDNLFVSDNLPKDLSEYQYVILDSVNKLGLSPQDLGKLKTSNPGVCFIYVFQTTKEGTFRGTNEFQHDVDVVIEVPERGKAVQYGRFNQGGEMNIFEEVPAEIKNEPAELSGIKKSKKKVSTTSNKKIEIEAEFGIPLEELALEVIKKGETKEDIIEICYEQPARINAAAQRMADACIKDAKAKVTLLKIKFKENDSHNLSHAGSYFSIILKGTEKELRKVASEDLIFFYDWESEGLDGLSNNSKHNLHTRHRSVMLDGTNKKSMKKTENIGDSPIKMVADINDPYTKKVIKNIWNAADKKKRAEILDSQGYSHKFIDWNFEDLTPAIMQLIITSSIDTPTQKPKQKIKDWTEPEWLNQSDWQNLKQIKKYYEAGDFEAAMNHASNCDTVIREEIPPEIWKAMGGQLTKTGEEKLKKAQNTEKFSNRPDDLNPNFIFSLTATQLLSEALKEDFDINYLIRHELAARGQDKEGKWVGFDKAKEIHQIE